MALAERAVMVAELRLDDKMSAGLSKASRKLDGLGTTAKRAGKAIGVGLAAVGTAAAAGIAVAVRSGIQSLQELEDANTATTSALEASGLAAKITAGQIRDLSNELEDASDAFFDDKDIQRGANALIRFGNLTEENFTRALTVSTDLGVRFGTVESAATNLARAMADPARATRVLRTAGVALTKAEEKKIKTLVESGKLAEAQAIILTKLEAKTKGLAKAAGGPYTDAMKKLNDAQEEATQALARGLLPVITEVADVITEELSKPGTMAAIEDFGKGLAGALREGVKWARQLPWDSIVGGLKAAAGFAKGLIDAFTSMPPQVQAAIIALAGLNKLSGGAITGIVGELGKGLIKGVLGMTAGIVNINAATVRGPGMGGGGNVIPKAAGATAAGLSSAAIASAAALGAGIALPFVMFNVIPELTKGKPGSSGPTLETNTNPAFATTAVLNSLAQSMTATQRATIGVQQRVSDVSADIRNGFTVQESAIKNGFTTLATGATATKEAIRNGFNVAATKTATLASTTRAGDERTVSRLASMDSATRSGLAGVKTAANSTASAIRGKRWQITVPVTVNNAVSVRAVTNGQTTVARYTGGTQTSRTIL